MEIPNSRIIDIAKKRTHPYISFGERFPIDNLTARLSFRLENRKICNFIVDFSNGNSKLKYDFNRLTQEIDHIEYISFSDSYIFNQFVDNYNSIYPLSENLTIEIVADKSYIFPVKLTGKKLKQLKFKHLLV